MFLSSSKCIKKKYIYLFIKHDFYIGDPDFSDLILASLSWYLYYGIMTEQTTAPAKYVTHNAITLPLFWTENPTFGSFMQSLPSEMIKSLNPAPISFMWCENSLKTSPSEAWLWTQCPCPALHGQASVLIHPLTLTVSF